MIAGYVIGGLNTSGLETVLIRTSGSALESFGVMGTLPDPLLTLNQSTGGGSQFIASDAGWGGSSIIAATAAQVGAFSWGTAPTNDSALVESLGTAAYTAGVTGAENDSGVVLVEIYDATPDGTYTPQSPRLINISVRAMVGTGSNVLIAGFVIGGASSRTVLIRASGPALGQFGVKGILSDPVLHLGQSSTGGSTKPLLGVAGWSGDPTMTAVAKSVGAFAWGIALSQDSAILVTFLPPGVYTAEVSGAGGGYRRGPRRGSI